MLGCPCVHGYIRPFDFIYLVLSLYVGAVIGHILRSHILLIPHHILNPSLLPINIL